MADLIYSAISSLDGYIEDPNRNFGWAVPDEEVHTFINNLKRSAGTYLYGRRLDETMMLWPIVRAATSDDELKAMYAYLHNLPPVKGPIE